jgi:hypothetical protein
MYKTKHCTSNKSNQSIHVNTIKKILRYINGISDAVLFYKGSKFTIRGYIDSYFAGDLRKRISSSGYVFTITGVIS